MALLLYIHETYSITNTKTLMISIIIPTYGTPEGLSEAIGSVLAQTYRDWELIVVDDNDPDSEARQQTEKLMETFSDGRIRYIRHLKNLNGAVARNTGFAIARGEYISLLDSDDMYLPERLEKCLAVMEAAPTNVAGVYTGCEFRRGGKVYHVETNVKPGNFLKETLACSFRFHTGSNIFVRKSVVDEINGFDPLFLRHQDYEFLARVFERYDLAAIPEVLVVKNNENVNLPKVQKMIQIKEQYLKKFSQQIEALSADDRCFVYHMQYVSIAEAALRSGEMTIARDYYKKASGYGSLSGKELLRRLAFVILRLLGQ